MEDWMAIWGQWLRPSAGLPTVQWSLLLAAAAAAGHLLQRHTGLPKVVGYSLVGTIAGLAGFSGAAWPLHGVGLFLLELGVAVVLFEAGGRLALRWFRHNPMVLLQSLLECTLTLLAVYHALRWLGVGADVAEAVALIAMAASPAVLSRVVIDTHAAGAVTERALALSTLSTLYALTLVSARAGEPADAGASLLGTVYPVVVVLGISIVVGAVIALALRSALRVMNPTSENTSILLICVIAAGTALAAHFGGSAPLAALLGGVLLKQLQPRPWAWPRQLGTAASLLTMLMFVLVSVVAARAEWLAGAASLVAAVVIARALAKIGGVALANRGSGTSLRQAFWTGCAMSPMSSVALLLVAQFHGVASGIGPQVAGIALPAILLMEVLGAIVATYALARAGESGRPPHRPLLPTLASGGARG
ncbi:cation:proton antiporter [Ramlibacter sp.]|uniref:cation:proton antiporter n=1 Tax=Ramlibacter sp. TaxID=1917967 RepID=UPI0035AF4C0E